MNKNINAKQLERMLWRQGQYSEPDYIFNCGEDGKIIANFKYIPNAQRPKKGAELKDLEQRTLMKLKNINTQCKFSITENSSDKIAIIKYDESDESIIFKKIQAIVCWECFSKPLEPIDCNKLFEKIKENDFTLWANSKEQIGSATTEINRKLKEKYNLEEDVLIYSSIPQIIVNRKYLY